MRERTHGHAGIDHPGPGEQQESWVRRPCRVASGPRPVRPQVPPGFARPEAGPRPVPTVIGSGEVDFSAAAPAVREVGPAVREVGPAVREVGPAVREVGPERRAGTCGPAGGGVLHARRRVTAHGPRLLVRRPLPPEPQPAGRVRRAVVGFAVVLAAAAVVFGLGQVADAMAHARVPAAPVVAEVTVTVDAPGTVWDVADGVAPRASGPERAAMVDRIVAANSLISVRVWPGEVLRVPLR